VARRRWWTASSSLFLLAALASCAGATDQRAGTASVAPPAATGGLTATPGIVRAGICPLGTRRLPLRADRIEAFQAELLRRLAFKLALRIQVSTLPSCSRPATALADQTVDLVVTAPGRELMAGRAAILQTEPYLVVQYALVVGAGSPTAKDGLGGLDPGTRVGVLAGTQGAAWASARLGPRGAAVVRFADERAMVTAITDGRCGALILPRASAVRVTSTVPGLRIGRLLDAGERATFLVAAANPGLRSRIDRMLEEIVFDGSYAAIFRRHFAATPVPVEFQPPD
jgi:ABC-type amino acid transport substrate-binding protein